jgi:esterase/lipase
MRAKSKLLLKILAILIVVSVAVNLITRYRAERALDAYLASFTTEDTPNATSHSMPRLSLGVLEKKPHGVLFIHGYPSSPSTFDEIFPRLREKGIPYYAPLLAGHGNTELNTLPHVSRKDWLRDGLVGYDIVAESAENVSIVSTSTGALIATWISQRREVNDLFFLVPNFEPGPDASRFKTILITPVASQAFVLLVPYKMADPQTLDDKSRFRYPFYECHSAHEMFRLQDEVSPDSIDAKGHIYLFTSKNDPKVSTGTLRAALERIHDTKGTSFTAYDYDVSHNILHTEAADDIVTRIVEAVARSAGTEGATEPVRLIAPPHKQLPPGDWGREVIERRPVDRRRQESGLLKELER